MKRQIAILAAGTLMAGIFVLPAPTSAQEDNFDYSQCQGRTITINTPKNDSVVGRTFVLSGKISTPPNYPDPTKAIFISIDNDNYLQPSDRNNPPFSDQNYPLADANGNFSFTVDLRGDRVVDTSSGKRGVSADRHRFIFGIVGDKCGGEVSAVDLMVKEDAPPTVTNTQPRTIQKPAVSPSLSPSPSIAPVMSTTPQPKTAGAGLNPGVALGLGALLGAALLALAEVSAVEYRKKHGHN